MQSDTLRMSTGRAPRRLTELLKELIQIGIALTSERDLPTLVELIVSEARRFTDAEAGALLLREDDVLRFSVVQNDARSEHFARGLRARLEGQTLRLDGSSLAGYVGLTGEVIALADAYALPAGSPFTFNETYDARTGYRTRSVLVVPLRGSTGDILGVLQLINARDAAGDIVPFAPEFEDLILSLATQAAVAFRNATLEDLSFKDPLTGAYNRRYFSLRIEEEAKRHTRFGDPVSLVLIDIDHFKPVNDHHGHEAGDLALQEITRVLMENSRDFSIVTRYGGDEFAVLLVNTPKPGALRYAERIKGVVERHVFTYARLTVSMGVASLPDDVEAASELISAADRALYAAKRLGRNMIQSA